MTRDILAQRLNLPFQKKAEIQSCDILVITDRNGVTEHHGLVSISPDKSAEWFIKKVRGQKLHGKLLVAREYHVRTNEDANMRPEDDNRRDDIEVTKLSSERISVVGLDSFKQEHH
ncbi:MAG: hypothetical protein ACWA5Q_02385 [bacterium]